MKGDRGDSNCISRCPQAGLESQPCWFPCKIILRLPPFSLGALAQDTSCTSHRPSSSAQKSVHRVEGRSSKTPLSTACSSRGSQQVDSVASRGSGAAVIYLTFAQSLRRKR